MVRTFDPNETHSPKKSDAKKCTIHALHKDRKQSYITNTSYETEQKDPKTWQWQGDNGTQLTITAEPKVQELESDLFQHLLTVCSQSKISGVRDNSV